MENIQNILVVSLSNIGDIIMTFPVLDILKRDFQDAHLDVIIGVKGQSLLSAHPAFRRVYLYRKDESGLKMLEWMMQLRKQRYDLVVDLRNTAIPLLIAPRYRTSLVLKRDLKQHMRQQHLGRLKTIHPFHEESKEKFSLYISADDIEAVDRFLPFSQTIQSSSKGARIITMAPGARAPEKRWSEEGFANLADNLITRYKIEIVFIGDEQDTHIIRRIKTRMKNLSVDLSGRLSFSQVGALMKASKLVISNDSAPMHLASYLGSPVAAIFGPTEPVKYGPWSSQNFIIEKKQDCLACQGKRDTLHRCLSLITAEDILNKIEPYLQSYE